MTALGAALTLGALASLALPAHALARRYAMGRGRRDAYSFPMAVLAVFLVAGLIALLFFLATQDERGGLLSSFVIAVLCASTGTLSAMAFVHWAPKKFPSRRFVEVLVLIVLGLSSLLAIMTTLGIVASLIFETMRFFEEVPVTDFLFGLHWSPQTALFEESVGSSGSFGALPVLLGTLMITLIALATAVPLGLLAAIYLAEFAGDRMRAWGKPVLEILSGIPTVVYGFFAALVLAPALRSVGERLGLSVASESALAAGLVMGVMLIPFISSLSDDALSAVPEDIRQASLALGATQTETIIKTILPAALPGVISGILLAFSRAIGETMIVVMAAGLAAKLTLNPFDAPTTITVQIVTLLVGDQEFDSTKTLAAFALGMLLFCVTLICNALALIAKLRYSARYE